MSRSMSLLAISLFAFACGPMEVEVVNETGADLVLDMPEQQEIIPPGTSTFRYTGAPSFNKRWTIPISVSGDYVIADLRLDAERKVATTLRFGSSDINAFVAEFENNTGARIDSLYVQHPSDGGQPLQDGMRPGRNLGPIADGASVIASLPHRSGGYHFVYYVQGEGFVDTSGRVGTQAAGEDVIVEL